MNYVVIDLEFNQTFDFPKGDVTEAEPSCPFEIIQIGAVVLNKNLKKVRQKRFFVKPQIYTRMHPYVHKLTGLTMKRLNNEKTFDNVYDSFISFIGKQKSVLCVWGSNDIKALYRNILYHNLNSKLLTKRYINVQQLASKHLNTSGNNAIGLKTAIETFDIKQGLKFHDALNDAIYTSEIFRKVYSPNIDFKTFNLSKLRQRNLAKSCSVNSGMLFNFVEREIKRNLNDKEKEVVIKIYNAGQNGIYE